MSKRNYPCDNLIGYYFDLGTANPGEVGELAFKRQLWMCMISQALELKARYRASNPRECGVKNSLDSVGSSTVDVPRAGMGVHRAGRHANEKSNRPPLMVH